jgi:uncharacterized protein involved in exopolysaccharide biosynthesis
MDEMLMVAPQTNETANEHPSLIGLMVVLARRKRTIFGLMAATAIVAGAITAALPEAYESTTKILPPQQAQSGTAALLSQLGGAAGLASGMAGLKNPGELYVGLLKSRTIADALIARFDLKKVYGTSLQATTRKQLADKTLVTLGKDSLITIEVEDKDPQRAAKLANAYVDQLFALNKNLAVTEAAQRRVFFEQQLKTAKDNLASAEIALKKGLDSRGVISVDVESRSMAETVGRLRAQISAKEIELNSIKAFLTETNPTYQRVEQELASLRTELSKLENGRGPQNGISPNLATSGSGLENIKLLRDVKYFQMLYELLAKQYEAARLDEARDPSVIQVLDPAIAAERPAKPRRPLIVVLATLFAGFFSVALALLSEAKTRYIQRPGNAAQWRELKRHLWAKRKNA